MTQPWTSQFATKSTWCAPLGVSNELLEPPEFRAIDRLVLQHVQNQEAGRTIEEACDEMFQGSLARLTLVDGRSIHKRSRHFFVGHVALRLEDSQDRLDGAVGHHPVLRQRGDDVTDGCRLALP